MSNNMIEPMLTRFRDYTIAFLWVEPDGTGGSAVKIDCSERAMHPQGALHVAALLIFIRMGDRRSWRLLRTLDQGQEEDGFQRCPRCSQRRNRRVIGSDRCRVI
jgi:hypothetical protein